MEFFEVFFPVSGVETSIFLPPLVALVISFFTSMGGVSGAFLILPFQMSVLGYVSPSVSATNFVYNIVAIPSGVYRYIKEGRMNWPLTWAIIAGTLPGVFIGYYIRVMYLPEPGKFKVFVGCVLLYLGVRLVYEIKRKKQAGWGENAAGMDYTMKVTSSSIRSIEFTFKGSTYAFGTASIFALSSAVGIVGGTYGIGGGAIIAPFLVAVLGLPVYAVAGAALMGTLITSVAGVFFYSTMPSATNTSPDWLLGALFGAGGFVGMYLGARAQRYVPQRLIKAMLAVALLSIAVRYIFLR
jgi:uncharacterized membrane protein YfcA